ncbi:GNAT family N-acetyltransferase [bacterium]|nr:MAG: GNAT family N-acetyltransferase [bacterium]
MNIINTNRNIDKGIKSVLGKLSTVKSVNTVKVKGKIIDRICIKDKSLGMLKICRLKEQDAPALFKFYFQGLSEKSRTLFPPYPLFSPFPDSAKELSDRIKDWGKENDWVFLNLFKDEKIIGVCLLKRFKTGRPTSGLAVREEFRKLGLGFLLQTIVNEQARLLNLKRIYVTLAQDNLASLRVHKKCGFRQTSRLVPHFVYKNGSKKIDRHDIEMLVEFNHVKDSCIK